MSIGGVYVGQQGLDRFLFLCRAFKINELKTEVTNRLAMLEKRVERKCTLAFSHSAAGQLLIGTSGSLELVLRFLCTCEIRLAGS